MDLFNENIKESDLFAKNVESIIVNLSGYASKNEINNLKKILDNLRIKINDFYQENRRLNIGVIGQVKAGKSSFLNALLFDGKEILPKASTPKTATLTKMEYSEKNRIHIEYYSVEEWEQLEENATIDLEDDIFTSAKEIMNMVRENGLNPYEYLSKENEEICFDSYDKLMQGINNYVGEDGKYTPIVKAVTLYLNKDEFNGLSIVDTPGLNDPIASRTIRTKEFIEVCDVVFFLSQAGSFLDKSDWTLLSSQLPQKGVKKLVLIASKYDSGIRDILKHEDEDDIFGEDENSASSIPKACAIIQKKLNRRAKRKVKEFIKDLEKRGIAEELVTVIKQCEEPVMISSMAHNMSKKSVDQYSKEEKNIYSALKQFSKDIEKDLNLLGDFNRINKLFMESVEEKENILREKEKTFLPNAKQEVQDLLEGYLEKVNNKLLMLEENDKEELLEQKRFIEEQIGMIKADIITLFGDFNARLDLEKQEAIQELRNKRIENITIQQRTGTKTKIRSYTTGHLWWKKRHEYAYDEHYSYCLATDAVEAISRYGALASNEIEKVFIDAIELRSMKRNLFNVIVKNFDMGSEKFNASLFKIMIEEVLATIEFPIFDINISNEMKHIANSFSGEITSERETTQLMELMKNAVDRIYDELTEKLKESIKSFKVEMKFVCDKIQNAFLNNIIEEFDLLVKQCENKEKEISAYQEYAKALEEELSKL